MLKLLLTCEHGGNAIPPTYAPLFEEHQDLLQTHRGYDIGALDLFHSLKDLADISFFSETSRLLIELNRTVNHAKLFSEITKSLSEEEKATIIKEHYVPYRSKVEQLIEDFISAGRRVLHVSIHTFTPELDGEIRDADIGLLYDSRRKKEQNYCRDWKKAIQETDSQLLVRFNYPYLGTADGFTTYLRRKFSEKDYIGIELEVNQKFALLNDKSWQHVKYILHQTMQKVIEPHRIEVTGDH